MTDERLESIVGNLLRAGVFLAASVVLVGGAWYLAAQGWAQPHYERFRPGVVGLRSMRGMGPAETVMFIGLLLLVATPVARVAFTLVAFALRGDRAYVVITAAVLAVLLYSIGTSWL